MLKENDVSNFGDQPKESFGYERADEANRNGEHDQQKHARVSAEIPQQIDVMVMFWFG